MSPGRNPLVSIGIPTYGRARTLGRAIESALRQEYRNIELVISDDASVDDTESVCRAHAGADARVRYVRQPRNIGLTRNVGSSRVDLQACKLEYSIVSPK